MSHPAILPIGTHVSPVTNEMRIEAGAVPVPTYFYKGRMPPVTFTNVYVEGKVLEIVYIGGQSANKLVVPTGTFTSSAFDAVVYPLPVPKDVQQASVA